MSAALRQVIEALADEPVRELRALGGGDIGHSARATLASGTRLFVKHYPSAPAAAVGREAEGLRWLESAGTVPVARVHGVDEVNGVLLLDWIEPGSCSRDGDAAFGRDLARLHLSGAETFGALPDNFIGSLPQSNRSHPSWAEFFGAERLSPQLRAARELGRFDATDCARGEQLIGRLTGLLGPEEAPARLHGDLWSGNRLCDSSGRSWLIDPAAYGGHREMDLAMMQLFGGFSRTVFDAYNELAPLAPGASERVTLCQLYPVLVHVNLFGGHYVESARRIIRQYL